MMEQKFHVGVKTLILNENDEILLLRANPEELKIEKIGHWDLLGGRIEGNDSIEETLIKEVEEELGTRDIEVIEHFDTLISNLKIPLETLEIVGKLNKVSRAMVIYRLNNLRGEGKIKGSL